VKEKAENPNRPSDKTATEKKYESPSIVPLDEKELDKVSGGTSCGSGTGALNSCVNGNNITPGNPCGSGNIASSSCIHGIHADYWCSSGSYYD
jgi:hypothetical protein